MRAPILKNRKRVYPGKSRAKPAIAASAPDTRALDTPAPAPAPALAKPARLDKADNKADTIALASETLRQICISDEAPSNAKATAARTLLELVGALGRHADPSALNTIPASEMSLEQLEARIAALAKH